MAWRSPCQWQWDWEQNSGLNASPSPGSPPWPGSQGSRMGGRHPRQWGRPVRTRPARCLPYRHSLVSLSPETDSGRTVTSKLLNETEILKENETESCGFHVRSAISSSGSPRPAWGQGRGSHSSGHSCVRAPGLPVRHCPRPHLCLCICRSPRVRHIFLASVQILRPALEGLSFYYLPIRY